MSQSPAAPPLPLDDVTPRRTQPPPVRVRGGGRGCVYALGGCFGMLVLSVALIGAALFATGSTVNHFFSGFLGLFSGGGRAPALVGFTVPEVEPFNNLAALTTLRYNYSGLVGVATDMPGLLQALYGASQVLVAVGSVEAGVDLSQMVQEDLRYDEASATLTIFIPGAAITNCFLDEQQTFVAERREALFAPSNIHLETQARRTAIDQFLQQALENNLLQDAQARAEQIVQQFAQSILDATNAAVTVRIVSHPIDSTTLPPTCTPS